MTPIQTLEAEIRGLNDRLTLRPTLDIARELGDRLSRAKGLVGHGHWLPWLARVGIRPRTAQVYMQISNTQSSADLLLC